jgi:hypothetical protein
VLLSKSPYYKEYHRGLRNQKTRMTPL